MNDSFRLFLSRASSKQRLVQLLRLCTVRFAIAGQAYDEFGVAGLGAEAYDATILFDDALDDAKSDARSDADGLGGVEGVEDQRLAFERYADSGVAEADAEIELGVGGAGGFLLG